MKKDGTTKAIAVDFDGCICEDRWPDIGTPYKTVIDDLLYRQSIGTKLILWTCREGELLSEAVGWCKAFGLRFDAVNNNLPERVAAYGKDCRKVSADEYWDDKARVVREGRVTVA